MPQHLKGWRLIRGLIKVNCASHNQKVNPPANKPKGKNKPIALIVAAELAVCCAVPAEEVEVWAVAAGAVPPRDIVAVKLEIADVVFAVATEEETRVEREATEETADGGSPVPGDILAHVELVAVRLRMEIRCHDGSYK